MIVLFITLSNINEIMSRGIYTDLIRRFRDDGHIVYIVSPCERRIINSADSADGDDCADGSSWLYEVDGVKILKVRTLNIQKTNVVEKGIGTLMIEGQFKKAIKKHLGNVHFDLILYSTPPITFTNVVRYLKKQNPQAIAYLLLKDIFPQNAVDIGMFGKKSFFNWYFRRKEMALYKASDYIGCMSPANVEFLRKHNPYYPVEKVEVAPNSISLPPCSSSKGAVSADSQDEQVLKQKVERKYIRTKYQLPEDKPIFIYGGNLGKPQGVDYLIQCLDMNKDRQDCFFLVVGSGTEYTKLEAWYNESQNANMSVRLMKGLPKEDYDMLVQSCDVGLIFLDHRFTIPNYPSRLLSYLENKLPVLCATDVNTDIGRIAEENGYGYWCESVNPEDFTALVDNMLASDRKAMGERGYEFLKENYLVEHTYNAIMKHFG